MSAGRLSPRTAVKATPRPGIAIGTIRPDAEAEDVLPATGAIWLIPDEPGWADHGCRVLTLLMDGLRHGARG